MIATEMFILMILSWTVDSRRHTLILKNDPRNAVVCSNFGFLKGGYLSISIERLNGNLEDILFTLDRSGSSDISSLVESKQSKCFRGEPHRFLYLSFDPSNKLLIVHNQDISLHGIMFEVSKSGVDPEANPTVVSSTLSEAIQLALDVLNLVPDNRAEIVFRLNELVERTIKVRVGPPPFVQSDVLAILRKLAGQLLPSDQLESAAVEVPLLRRDLNSSAVAEDSNTLDLGDDIRKPVIAVLRTIYHVTTPLGSLRFIPYQVVKGDVQARFTMRFPNSSEEGAYNFYVHHCPSLDVKGDKRPSINLTLVMVEKNPTSFLSAGHQPLPVLYSVMCCIYLLTSLFWLMYLRVSKNSKFKIHYLMFTVILVKSISVAFLAINYYVIGKHGVHEEGWAVMYYITHIIRGVLLFTTILLIGAGWTFIKHMLTPREQSLFMVVIPLQILANIATAVIEESEAGATRYALWKDIFILVDLACCCAILFPVMWSIRHLQAASHTDGKAAVNLRNLRLFPQFYIMVIGYVYSTRVIAYLFAITMPYSLTWVIDLFKEAVTFVFFVAVGYRFRPVEDNPYLLVPNDADEDEDTVMERIQLEDVWSQSGFAEGVTRLGRPQSHPKRNNNNNNNTTVGKSNPVYTDRGTHADS